jgi:tetratricopeptide (TPR) repeat protein
MLGIAGLFFGVLAVWIIGSQRPFPVRQPPPAAAAAGNAQPAPLPGPPPPPLDESKAAALKAAADRSPRDAAIRVELGNLYFDHQRFPDAARWYQDALRIEPRNVNASTDLGIAYYYMNQPDTALQQFDRSLAVDPAHAKTLLNVGIVRALGKQDLDGAVKAWQRVIELAPKSPEAETARGALQRLRNAHPESGADRATPQKDTPEQPAQPAKPAKPSKQ